MQTKTKLAVALIAALGITATSAYSAVESTTISAAGWQRAGVAATYIVPAQAAHELLAAKGSSGKGKVKGPKKPEDNGVDGPDTDEDVNMPGCDVSGRGDICHAAT